MNKFLIKKPIVTEKSVYAGKLGKYTFWVDDAATSSEVKKIVENQYGVNVVKANVINAKPKKKRFGRSFSVKAGYKKVIVTLKKGQKLDILPE